MARRPNPAHRPPGRWLRVRVWVVVAEGCVEKLGSLTVAVPPGIPRGADGRLAAPVQAVQAGPATASATALRDKVLNEGRLPVDVVVGQPDPEPCPDTWHAVRQRVEVPFSGVLELPGVRPGDAVRETLEVEALRVAVETGAVPEEAGPKPRPALRLRITAVVRACFRVEREEVVTIRADP